MRDPLFTQPLNYFPIITKYDPFKSFTYLSQILHMSPNQISMIFSLEYSLHNYLLEMMEEIYVKSFLWINPSIFLHITKLIHTLRYVAAATCFPDFSLLLKLRDPSLSFVAQTYWFKVWRLGAYLVFEIDCSTFKCLAKLVWVVRFSGTRQSLKFCMSRRKDGF